MIVMKFGGTSVKDAERIQTVLNLVRKSLPKKPLVVVSAHSGVTNMLLQAAKDAIEHTRSYQQIVKRHRDILKDLNLEPALLDEELGELKELLRGIQLVRELTPRTRDYIAAFGERLSCKTIAAYFVQQGLPAVCCNTPDYGFITDSNFGNATLLPGQDEEIGRLFKAVNGLPVITGFIAKNRQGDYTTFSRSGSDLTAAIVGAAVNAAEIQIWTDVDGVMTADPSVVKEAKSIPIMSFEEASELAYFGARVLHPDCVWPAVRKNIPVRVLNTFRPDHPGTVIVGKVDEPETGVRAIAYKENQTMFNIVSTRMFMSYGFMAKVFEIFERYRVPVDMISTSEVSVSLTASDIPQLEEVVKELSFFAEVTVDRSVAVVAVVGSFLRDSIGAPGLVFETLRQMDIPVEMISVGASKVNISFVVKNEFIDKTVKTLHKTFFEC